MDDRITRFDYEYGDTIPGSPRLKTVELARIGTISDGNCWYHAFCRVTSPTYRSYGYHDRRKFVRNLREETAMLMTHEVFTKLTIADSEVGTVDKHYGSAHAFRKHINSDNWVGEEVTEFMSDLFEVDIIILYYTDHEFGVPLSKYLYSDRKHGKKYSKSIILLNIDNNHFEGVGIIRHGYLYTLFESDDPIIIALKTEPIPFIRRSDK